MQLLCPELAFIDQLRDRKKTELKVLSQGVRMSRADFLIDDANKSHHIVFKLNFSIESLSTRIPTPSICFGHQLHKPQESLWRVVQRSQMRAQRVVHYSTRLTPRKNNSRVVSYNLASGMQQGKGPEKGGVNALV